MNSRQIVLSIWNLLGRAVNSFLFIAIANFYGTNQYTDWFFFVYSIAYFFIGVSYYATESALVPVWHKLSSADHHQIFRSAFSLALYCFLAMIIVLPISGLYLAPLQGILLPDSVTIILLICFLLATQPSLAFLSSVFSSYRQFKQQYVLPTLHLTLRAIVVLAVLLVVQNRTITILSVAYIVGELCRFLCLQRNIFTGPFLKVTNKNSCLNLKSIYGNVVWMTIALMGTVINPVIDLAMVGRFGDGSVTIVEYANRLRGIPVLSLGGIAVYYLGEWSYQHYRGGAKLDWNRVSKVVNKTILYSIPLVILLMLLEKVWIPMIFFSKKITPQNLQQLTQLLYWYFPGVPFLAGSVMLSRVIIVTQKAKLLAFITLFAALLNAIFNMFFLKIMGLIGVAFSTTIVDIFTCLAFYVTAKKILNNQIKMM